MYDKLKKEYSASVSQGQSLFQQNNAKPNTTRLIMFKQIDSVEIVPHPPFHPNAALSDYGLFNSVTHFFRDQQFNNFDAVKEACLQFFLFKAS